MAGSARREIQKGELTEMQLMAEGWDFIRESLFPGYHKAGSTLPMKTRRQGNKRYQYIRVFHSTTINRYQLTTVYRKQV